MKGFPVIALQKISLARSLARAWDADAIDTTIDLTGLRSLDDAETVQTLARLPHSHDVEGFSLAATSPRSARLLSCKEPVCGPLFRRSHVRSGGVLRVTPTMIGVGAQVAFTFGVSYPSTIDEPLSVSSLSEAIFCCRIGLHIPARRVSAAANAWMATADFGLAGVYVEGPSIKHWRERIAPEREALVRIDGRILQRGHLGDVMGGPLNALLWLSQILRRQGRVIDAGAIVTTGSCTGLLQLVPNQTIVGDFGELGAVSVVLA